MTEPVAVFPPPDSTLGVRSWARELAWATVDTLKPEPLPASALPRGDGSPVLIIPGFGAGDWVNLRLKSFLGEIGYQVQMAGIPFNPGPSRFVVNRLESALQALSQNGKVSLVGISLGGALARDLARRHPDRVRCVVTLCTPIRFPVSTPLQPLALLFSPLYARPWVERRHEIEQPLPMPVTAIHVSEDGIVEREQCWLAPSPGARNVLLEGRHICVASNPRVMQVIAESLAAA